MAAFLHSYAITIVVGLVLALIVFLAIRHLVKNKREGKSSCGCGCQGCPRAGYCHKQ